MKTMSVKVVPVLLFFVALVLSPYSIIADDVVDVVQIQSVTSSSESHWSKIAQHVGTTMKWLDDLGPDTRFGCATFGDKNIAKSGSKSGLCLHVDEPLAFPNATRMIELTKGFQKKAAAMSKGDEFDSVFEGVYRAVLAPGLKWRPKMWKGKNVHRLVVAVVDTVSHLKGDGLKVKGKNVRPFDITKAGMVKDKNENYDCDEVDYPSVKQLADLLNELEVALVVVVAPGGSFNSKGKFTPFKRLAKEGSRYHGENGLELWYRDQLHKANVRNFLVAPLGSDALNYEAVYAAFFGQFYKQAKIHSQL